MKASFSSLDVLIVIKNVSLLRPMYTERRCRHIAMSDKLRLRFLKGKSLFLAIGNCEIKPDPCNSTFICVLDAPPLAVSSFSQNSLYLQTHHRNVNLKKEIHAAADSVENYQRYVSIFVEDSLSANDIVSSFSSLFRISSGREEDLDLLRVTGTGRPYLSDPPVSKQSCVRVDKRCVGFKKKSK